MGEARKLLLVDGSALAHRAYHAYPKLTNKQGQPIQVVYGVASMLIAALQEEKATHVGLAWDVKGPTFRHEEYVAYKATRPKTDEELLEQIPMVKEMVASLGIKEFAREGYEADDILGSLARRFYEEVEEIVIVTGDQDLMQLVNEKVKVFLPARGKVGAKKYGEAEVEERYGVKPAQIVDYKALVGDSSDNIPGVMGVGPKTAAKLLRQWGSLEAIYQALREGKIEEKVAAKLREGEESAWLSQKLALIKSDVDLGVELAELEFGGLEKEQVREFLAKMGFQSLLRRIFGTVKKEDKQGRLF